MATIAYDFLNNINDFLNKNSDPRTKGLPFMDSPMPFFIITTCYLYFVCKAGPRYMKDRKPYNLKTVIALYNAFQIASCIYLIHAIVSINSLSLFRCDKKNFVINANGYKTAKLVWWTIMLKLTEYLETVFFVLRKKQNQVSGLHLYHHVSTLLLGWVICKFSPGLEAVAPIVLNCFIHVLMYSYYLLAVLGGREFQKKLFLWKRSLTILQMVQFTLMIMHLLKGFSGECAGHPILLYVMLLDICINYVLFYKFYRKAYKKTN